MNVLVRDAELLEKLADITRSHCWPYGPNENSTIALRFGRLPRVDMWRNFVKLGRATATRSIRFTVWPLQQEPTLDGALVLFKENSDDDIMADL
ncbi:MAG: hypothetical protein ABIU05_02275 [Nitrospirales bacterium]